MEWNDNNRKWVELLRSGEFEQGRGRLARRVHGDSTRYCCLGLAADKVLGVLRPTPYADVELFCVPDDTVAGGSLINMLSDGQVTSLGMRDYEASALASLNDTGSSFSEIADVIAYACDNHMSIKEARIKVLGW